jgi:predicted  nucleic acid-binding Zn-ribbon protein
MNEENKGNHVQDEIDDFAKALLDKKTERQLYGDSYTSEDLSNTQRLYAQRSQNEALSRLRKEQQDPSMLDLDITGPLSYSAPEEETPAKPAASTSAKTKKSSKASSKKSSSLSMPSANKKKKKKTAAKKSAPKKSALLKAEPEEKVNKKSHKKFWLAALFVVLAGIALMGGYTYKVLVWDPQNAVSEEQQASYDKLVDYADEYDMMSDTEKLELLTLNESYEALSDKMKEQIEAYFKEQTGKTYSDLYSELKSLSDSNDESNPTYTALQDFFNAWNEMSESGRATMVNYKSDYDSLSQTLKNKIDTLIMDMTGTNFANLYSQYTMQKPDYSEQINALTSQINELQSQIDESNQYATSLQEEYDQAVQNGADEAALNEISANMSQNQQTIEQLQSQIDALNQEMQQYLED